jgi:hypothetical protein
MSVITDFSDNSSENYANLSLLVKNIDEEEKNHADAVIQADDNHSVSTDVSSVTKSEVDLNSHNFLSNSTSQMVLKPSGRVNYDEQKYYTGNNIKVACRIKPSTQPNINIQNNEKEVFINVPGRKSSNSTKASYETKIFPIPKVFGPTSSTSDIYIDMPYLIKNAFDGRQSLVLCHGACNTGILYVKVIFYTYNIIIRLIWCLITYLKIL